MIEIQRYMVFFSSTYYPNEGIQDIIGQSDKLQDAIEICLNYFTDSSYIDDGHFHIVDLEDLTYVRIANEDKKPHKKMFYDLQWKKVKNFKYV